MSLSRVVLIAGSSLMLASGLAVAQEPLDCVMHPRTTIELGSPDEGILDEVLVERGDVVTRGEVVGRLDGRLERLAVELSEIRAQSDLELRSGRRVLEFRQLELGRMEELREKNMAPQRGLDEAEIEWQLAALQLERADLESRMAQVQFEQAKIQLDRRLIRSPVDGLVVDVTMSPGEFAHKQIPVMTIAEIDPLYVEVFVPVERYGTVIVGSLAEVMPQAPIGGVYAARVRVVDRVFDPASGTFGVRLELPNPDHRLPAGLRCSVRFADSTIAAADDVGVGQ